MELSSSINSTWKLCILGSLFGCLILLIFLNQNNQNTTFSAAENTLLESRSFPLAEAPTSTKIAQNTVLESPSLEAPMSTMIVNNTLLKSPSSAEPEAPMSTVIVNNTLLESPSFAEAEAPMSTMIVPNNLFDSPSLAESEAPMSTMIVESPHSTSIANFINETSESTKFISNVTDEKQKSTHHNTPEIPLNTLEKQTKKTNEKRCNIFDGRWVYKLDEKPYYDKSRCSFIEEKMSCQNNGRPDFEYEKWRWEAKDCDIPLFNGSDMLERLRNKRVVMVGDSLNRNMWESLACLLYSSVPPSRAEVQDKSQYKFLKVKDYNTIVEFHWSPFLIEYDINHKSGKKVLVLDKLSPNSKQWRGADVMVFNSGHWWTHKGSFKKWDLLEYDGKPMEEMPVEQAYELGMKTWAKWIHKNINPNKTSVFFRSISANHNGRRGCYNVTQPIMDESYINNFPKSLINVIESLINGMNKLNVKYLNITKLSEYRIDAHPSVYRSSWKWRIYTTKYKRLIPSFADCSHWCLPGLPDTWNRLFYASLFFDGAKNMPS